ncbi:LLM class F420-dependent oxidoreductase [Rhodococcus rhodnii]|nr:LLM class F420-dependent oxidoreductase [Rhodococcus rhodnii]TXG89885.1 LLM class F420-dependent oxidoreductase [Rhodococcus rhodnii]
MTDPTIPLPTFGQYGVWRQADGLQPEVGREIEKLGYTAIWVGGSPPAGLHVVERLLDATESITIATGIVNIWTADAHEIAASYHRIEERHPGRFVLGIGAGHPEAQSDYTRPYAALERYLDVLDDEGVPTYRRVLAALGPRVLALAAARAGGAHPYLTTPEHTHEARTILGEGPLLAPEQKIVVSRDPDEAREIGREAVANPYLQLSNYVQNLKRSGWTDADIENGGSDALIDALVAHGEAPAIVPRLREHLDAGADHVAVQALPMAADPIPALRAIAQELGLEQDRAR